MKNNVKSTKSFRGEGGGWCIALRERTGESLYRGNTEGFIIIKNSIRYWRADPFLFEHEGKTYLFAELFDRLTGKGKLGVARIKNGGKCGRFKVCLKLPYHLSYPCVFRSGDEILMIPECGRSGRITAYKAVEFPYKWEEAFIVCYAPGVDTTPIPSGDGGFKGCVTTVNKKERDRKNDNLYLIPEPGQEPSLLRENDEILRPAGHFIRDGEDLIRPVQDCTEGYGCGLVFMKCESLDPGSFSETPIIRTAPSDLSLSKPSKREFTGIHTYNSTDTYEVVDLGYTEGVTLQYLIKKTLRHFGLIK